MKTLKYFGISVLCSFAIQLSAQCNAPKINNFSPVTGFIGSTVTINGANFSSNISQNQVFFGATQATVLSAAFGTLTVTVPVGASTAPISVRNNCNLIAYSQVSFNGIFCPTPITSSTYQNTAFTLSNIKGAYNMQSYDMDLDGKPDVICGGLASTGMTIAKNNSTPGTLSFSATNLEFSFTARNQVMVDFDGDGKLDIAMSGNQRLLAAIRNLSSPGSMSFGSLQLWGSGSSYQIGAGDFDNDGKIDVCVGSGGTIVTFRNTSTGPGTIAFVQNNSFTTNGSTITGLQCADVDGDGYTDIIGTQGNNNRAVTFRNNNTSNSSSFSFESPEYWPSGGSYPYRCQLADFDKDGRVDLTTCNFYQPNTAILRNTSTAGDISLGTAYTVVSPGSNYRIQVGDVDGDGFPDIVTKSSGSNVFSVYRNTSSGAGSIALASRIDYSSSAAAEVSGIVIGDLDGDYVPDIATSGTSSRAIRFHRNTSSQSDQTAPTAICKNITVGLGTNGTVTVTAAMINNGSSDACGIDSLKINNAVSKTFTCSDTGNNTVTLKVVDRAGNTSTCTATVRVMPAAIITAGQTTVCQGQTVKLVANPGDSYKWYKNGTLIADSVSQSIHATTSGNYKVEVVNSGGCSGISDATQVTVNNNPTVDVTPASTAPLCSGSALLKASLSSIYQWRKDGVNIAGANIQTYNATSAGTYSVRVIDVFGCSATSSNVVVTSTTPEINVKGNNISIVDGDLTPSAADGTDMGTVGSSMSTFKIFNSGNEGLYVSNINVGGANPSNFTVGGISLPKTIAAGDSASFTVTFSLATISVKNAEISILNSDCDEANYNFAVTGELSCTNPAFTTCPSDLSLFTSSTTCDAIGNYTPVVGGIPAPAVTYTFSGKTSGSGSGDGSGSTFNLGTSTVTLSATNACSTAVCTFDIVVVDNVKPTVLAKNISATLVNGSVTVLASDIDDGSYDNCEIDNLSVSPSSFDCTDIGEHDVTLTVKDVNGNEDSKTIKVTVLGTIPTVSISPSIAEFCKGLSVDITATGSETGTYEWNTSETSATITVGTAGDYTVTFTNGNGCEATATRSVIQNNNPIANAGADLNLYYGYTPLASDTIMASASGGTPSYSYSWNTGANTQNIVVGPTSSTTYTLTVTDSKGCKGTDQVRANVQDVRCGKKLDKVLVCHNTGSNKNPTQEICIDENGVPAHIKNHQCVVGSCSYSWGDVLELGTTATLELTINPVTSSSSVKFYIPSDDDITVKLYNNSGTLLGTIYNGSARSGNIYSYGLDYSLFTYTGTYYIKLVSSTENVTITALKN